jgi:1,4-alpha-glucan branching enzyme
MSTTAPGFAPRYWEEVVGHLSVSSAATLLEEFHVDGLRVDLNQAIHRDNVLHADNRRGLSNANVFGQKMLREWSRTLGLIKPSVMLIAEDHTGWAAVAQLPEAGGLGFGATWFASFYHNLLGDSDAAGSQARLIKTAGEGGDGPLDPRPDAFRKARRADSKSDVCEATSGARAHLRDVDRVEHRATLNPAGGLSA